MATNMQVWNFTNFSAVHNYLFKHFCLIYWFIIRQSSCLGLFVYIFIKTCICVSFVFTVDPEYRKWQQNSDLIIFLRLRFLFCLFFYLSACQRHLLNPTLSFYSKIFWSKQKTPSKPDLEPLFKRKFAHFFARFIKKIKIKNKQNMTYNFLKGL